MWLSKNYVSLTSLVCQLGANRCGTAINCQRSPSGWSALTRSGTSTITLPVATQLMQVSPAGLPYTRPTSLPCINLPTPCFFYTPVLLIHSTRGEAILLPFNRLAHHSLKPPDTNQYYINSTVHPFILFICQVTEPSGAHSGWPPNVHE